MKKKKKQNEMKDKTGRLVARKKEIEMSFLGTILLLLLFLLVVQLSESAVCGVVSGLNSLYPMWKKGWN